MMILTSLLCSNLVIKIWYPTIDQSPFSLFPLSCLNGLTPSFHLESLYHSLVKTVKGDCYTYCKVCNKDYYYNKVEFVKYIKSHGNIEIRYVSDVISFHV